MEEDRSKTQHGRNRSDPDTDMKRRTIRLGIGATLLVACGLFWLLLILGTSDADGSPGDVILGGLAISALPIGVGVWLLRSRSSYLLTALRT